MKKTIKLVDEKRGIVQVTCVDQRHYGIPTLDAVSGIPLSYTYRPSVTFITAYWPKGEWLVKWIADTGWDQAKFRKEAAGEKGSIVHQGSALLISGQTVRHDALLRNPETGEPQEISAEEYLCLVRFAAWHAATAPQIIAHDFVVVNEEHDYAGTVDFCMLTRERVDEHTSRIILWVVDIKTSPAIYMPHRLQVSAYKHTPEIVEMALQHGAVEIRTAILGLNQQTKLGYKFTPTEDCFELFLHTKAIWAQETSERLPFQKDLPLSLCLTNQKEPVQ